jgi:predicted TIM-barrel fold metal-dependent hydrolase
MAEQESLTDNVVADSDLHVMEPPDLWQRYIDPSYAHAAPIGLTEIPRDMRVRVKNHTLLRLGRVRPVRQEGHRTGWRPEHDSVYADPEARGWDPASQVGAMDAEGLDMAVLFPSRGLFVLGLDSVDMIGPDGLEPEYASAIARAYNDWLSDFCRHAPDRMYGAAMVAPHDVDGAVAEARRCVEDLGFRAIFLAPGCVNRRPWHHPAYDPLWAEIERLDVAAAFHGGGQTYLRPDFSLEVLDRLMMWHTFNQPRARTVPQPARGPPRGQLLVGTLAAPPVGRAPRVDGVVRGYRPDPEAVRVLPAELLHLARCRRGDGGPLRRLVRRRQPGVLHRLPPRRLAVSARRRGAGEAGATS